MNEHFHSVSEIAREQFFENLKAFYQITKDRGEAWTDYRLLQAAGMDLALIRRVEEGQSFQVGSLDKLQDTMSAIVDGEIKLPKRKVRKKRKKAPARKARAKSKKQEVTHGHVTG